jgi:hypothetical protein
MPGAGTNGVSSQRASVLVIANDVSSSRILVTLIMEAIISSEMSVIKGATQRNIPEDVILY